MKAFLNVTAFAILIAVLFIYIISHFTLFAAYNEPNEVTHFLNISTSMNVVQDKILDFVSYLCVLMISDLKI